MSQAVPARPPHIMTLVIATATGALSMNVFLPSLPGMARYFDTSYATVQLTVSLYLVSTAFFQFVIGPASDRFGRRPVMLVSLGAFLLATFAAIFSTSIEMLLLFRVLQAFAAGGVVISRAVVRDTVSADEAATRISYITMGMALVPMVAPTIGGFLDEIYGWHAPFVFTFLLGLVSFTIVYLDLRETNHARSSSLASQIAAYPSLLSSRRFWGYTLTGTLSSGGFFAMLGGGPFVATEILQMTPSVYGLYAGLLSVGYVVGNFLSGRFSRAVGLDTMMVLGNITSIIAFILSLGLFLAGIEHPLALFGPAAVAAAGNGMSLPNANAGMISVRPHLAGSASGLGGAIQIGGGAILSVFAGASLSQESGVYPLLWVMLIATIGALAAALYVIRVNQTAKPLT